MSWDRNSPIINKMEKTKRQVVFMAQIFHVFQCPNNTLKKVFRLILYKGFYSTIKMTSLAKPKHPNPLLTFEYKSEGSAKKSGPPDKYESTLK